MILKHSFLFVFLLALNIAGCVTAPPVEQPLSRQSVPGGMYHRVERGETLWRISKMYNMDMDELAIANRITDTTSIELGQLILIPSVQKRAQVCASDSSEDFIWPLRGRMISSFGSTFNNMVNKGLNIAPLGNLEVVAARGGKVVFYSDNFGGFGKTIIIDHGDGLSSVYARNAEVFVRPGDSVQKGSAIARAGTAGRDKSVYLHFEIRKKHIPQNPNFYLP